MSRLLPAPQLLQAAARIATRTSTCSSATRAFSSLPTLRPTTLRQPSIFRSPTLFPTTFAPAPSAAAATLDLVPKTSITAHPALAHIRCGPRPTMAKTSRLKRQRKFGFLARLRTPGGRKVLARRKAKGRKRLSA